MESESSSEEQEDMETEMEGASAAVSALVAEASEDDDDDDDSDENENEISRKHFHDKCALNHSVMSTKVSYGVQVRYYEVVTFSVICSKISMEAITG